MVSDWHLGMQLRVQKMGQDLGFHAEEGEYYIPQGRIDCVWSITQPFRQPFVAFEFELGKPNDQQIANVVKVLSMDRVQTPRFLVQCYRLKLPSDKKEYLQRVGAGLPLSLVVIDEAGDEIPAAANKVVRALFGRVGTSVAIPRDLREGLVRVLGRRETITGVHIGEAMQAHLSYLDNALIASFPNHLLLLDSVTKPTASATYGGNDLLVVSDIPAGYAKLEAVGEFIDRDVRKDGRLAVFTGGFGLTRLYSDYLGEEKMGGVLPSRPRANGEVRLSPSESRMGLEASGLRFEGHNIFRVGNPDEVWARWNPGNDPALIVHPVGRGHVVVFTSDCSPGWGTPAIETQRFRDFWGFIVRNTISAS